MTTSENLPPLRQWQGEALDAWKTAGQRGIVVAATGTGKTRVALEAINEALGAARRVVVIVPTIALQDQWFDLLRYQLRLGPQVLGTMGGRSATFDLKHRVILSVLDSARDRLPGLLRYWAEEGDEVLLIVDECHRVGSQQARELLNSPTTSSLGLSATPQRDDGRFDELIEHGLGLKVYELPLRRALDDGLLAPLRLLDLYFQLPAAELHDFKVIQARAADLQSALSVDHPSLRGDSGSSLQVLQDLALVDERARRLLSLFQQNRRLVANSRVRRAIFTEMVTTGVLDERRAIVFNETIEQAESSLATIEARGLRATIDHSKVPAVSRRRAIKDFASGLASVLVAVRTVDEGIDVPDADLAVIVSGTLTRRQRVQRIGRVVRPSGGKTASVISILARATTEEFFVGMEDSELLGPERVRFHDGPPGPEEISWALGDLD